MRDVTLKVDQIGMMMGIEKDGGFLDSKKSKPIPILPHVLSQKIHGTVSL